MALSVDLKDIKPILGGLFGGGKEETAAPPASMTPPPPQATPAVAGFSEWSGDPMNQEKVAHGLTQPGQPIIPPDVRANANLTPPPMASASMSSLAPPPNMPAPPPNVSMAPPPVNPGADKLKGDQAELARLQKTGSGASQINNPALRTLAKVGDVAGTILAPRIAEAIPGTTLHNYMLQGRAQGNVANDQTALSDAANLERTQQQIAMAPEQLDIKQQAQDLKEQQAQDQLARQYAQMGFKGTVGPDGKTTFAEDPDSPITKTRKQKDELLSAQVESTKAQEELRRATAALKAAGNDPKSPAYQLAWKKAQTAQQNANAASTRAQAYMGKYMQSAYGTGLDNKALPGATTIADDAGNETTVGTGNASAATKNQANAAMFNEVSNATTDIENKAESLVKRGGRLNDPSVATAIADPKTNSTQWAQGQFVNSNLSPEQRDYVIAVKAYHERLQPLRKSAGGGISDAQVDRLMQMAPGAATPDLDYLKRQTAAIRQLQGNLATGATTSKGGLKIQKPGGPPPVSGGSYKQTATGPNGHKIGSNDGGKTWADVKTGKAVQ